MELAESQAPGSAVKLRRAPTLVAVSARTGGDRGAGPRGPAGDAPSPPTSCCSAPMRAAWPPTGARCRCSTIRGRASCCGWAPEETPVGLLYLGEPVQEQRVPERAPAEDYVVELD